MFAVLNLLAGEAPPSRAPYQWRRTDVSVALVVGDRIAWQFNYGPREPKPYFHPITAVDGTELTANRPADHPWHHGLWWSWKYINGVNYWDEDKSGQSAGRTVVVSTQVETRPDFSARIVMKLAYRAPGAEPVLTEDRIIEVAAPDRAQTVAVTWQATFTAEKKPVLLDRTPLANEPNGFAHGGYAGLSLRLAPRSKEWEFRDSENGQSQEAVHGGTARYLRYGLPAGPGVWFWDDEKANPRFPTTWYADRKLDFMEAAFLYRGPFTLAPGKTLAFGYRVIFNPVIGKSRAPSTNIRLSVVPGKMRYDIESFEVLPGSSVTLRLRNDDDMTHNLVLCDAPLSFGDELGAAVIRLGEAGIKKDYVPDLPQIFAHTKLIEPGQGESIAFVAPSREGDYPYFCTMPGHWVLMKGVMRVTKNARALAAIAPAPPNLPPIEITVGNEARVERLPMPDASPTALAVGLPGGTNYCFDVEKLAVRYTWRGRFIDQAPNLERRGGETVKLLGQRFNVGYAGGPWLGDNLRPTTRFKGYRTVPVPVIYYSVDGAEFAQTVSGHAGSGGVVYAFEVSGASAAIHFKVNPVGLKLTATGGTIDDNGVLTVRPASDGALTRFSVTIEPAN